MHTKRRIGKLLSTPSQKSNTVAGSGGDEVVEGPTPEVVKREVVKRIASEQEHFARLQSESSTLALLRCFVRSSRMLRR